MKKAIPWLEQEGSRMVKRLQNVSKKDPFALQVDDDSVLAFPGETLATAILASGKKVMRLSDKMHRPRSYYCGMGLCNECLVILEDGSRVRACQTPAVPSMKIKTR
jgi:sarcosine oxidase subunit alpha